MEKAIMDFLSIHPQLSTGAAAVLFGVYALNRTTFSLSFSLKSKKRDYRDE